MLLLLVTVVAEVVAAVAFLMLLLLLVVCWLRRLHGAHVRSTAVVDGDVRAPLVGSPEGVLSGSVAGQ